MDIEPDIVICLVQRNLANIKGKIEFDNVTFRYTDNTPNVLKNLSLTVEAGKNLAIVGPSGGG